MKKYLISKDEFKLVGGLIDQYYFSGEYKEITKEEFEELKSKALDFDNLPIEEKNLILVESYDDETEEIETFYVIEE